MDDRLAPPAETGPDDLALIRARIAQEANLAEIARATGLGYSWLKMFARGAIPDPAYSRVRDLAAYFRRTTP